MLTFTIILYMVGYLMAYSFAKNVLFDGSPHTWKYVIYKTIFSLGSWATVFIAIVGTCMVVSIWRLSDKIKEIFRKTPPDWL
jgi:hypothetical protein